MSFSYDCVVHCVIDELGPSFEVFVCCPDPGIQYVDVHSAPITCHVVGRRKKTFNIGKDAPLKYCLI